MARLDQGECEYCGKQFNYTLLHSGFGDQAFAYCEACGMLATLDAWNPKMKELPQAVGWHHEINSEIEPYLNDCSCGGHFQKGASPRCPHCLIRLSAEHATTYIERNAAGTAKGWRWQKNWSGLYSIAIEDVSKPGTLRTMKDPFRIDR